MPALPHEAHAAFFKQELMSLLPMFELGTPALVEDEPAIIPQDPQIDVDPSRWRGFLDRVEGTVAHGWCFDAQRPMESVMIEAVGTNGRSLTGQADIFRQDVFDAGFGSGRHGFCLDLAELDPRNCQITIRFAENKLAINQEPISLDAQLALLDEPMPEAYYELFGQLANELRSKHAQMQAQVGGSGGSDQDRYQDRRAVS